MEQHWERHCGQGWGSRRGAGHLQQAQAGRASAVEVLRGGGGLNRRALQQRQARQRPELAAQPGRVRRVGACSGAGQQCQ